MTGAEAGRTVLHAGQALLPEGWASNVRLVIADGRIARVWANQAAEPGDIRIGIGLPAVGNLHSHAFQRAMAGLTELGGAHGDSFWSWRQLMYRFVDRLDPDAVQAIAAQAYMEMLEAGFGRVGEFHYLHNDVDGRPYADRAEMGGHLAAAAAETGIGLTLLPVFYAHGGFGGSAPGEAQRRFLTSPDDYAMLLDASRSAIAVLPDAVLGIAPHSLRAVSPEELAIILPLAGAGPVHIHIAEQVREVEECIACSGTRPVRWLLDNADVDARWCLVHATHVDDDETSAVARSGAVVGLCPITEANLGDGIFPARRFLDAGGAFGIGSDSNVRIDMTEELRLLEYGQRLSERRRNVLGEATLSTGRNLFDHSVAGGAQALGVKAGLVVGAAADIVSLRTANDLTVGRSGDAIIDTLIFSAGQGAVADVWRAGRHVVTDGRHVDRDAIESRFRRVVRNLLLQ